MAEKFLKKNLNQPKYTETDRTILCAEMGPRPKTPSAGLELLSEDDANNTLTTVRIAPNSREKGKDTE